MCLKFPAWVDSPYGDINHDGKLNYGKVTEDPTNSVDVAEVFPPTNSANNPDTIINAVSGEAHFPAECANRGLCNRDSGICECFPGYTGAGCQRCMSYFLFIIV
jgi:EGF-like domain